MNNHWQLSGWTVQSRHICNMEKDTISSSYQDHLLLDRKLQEKHLQDLCYFSPQSILSHKIYFDEWECFVPLDVSLFLPQANGTNNQIRPIWEQITHWKWQGPSVIKVVLPLGPVNGILTVSLLSRAWHLGMLNMALFRSRTNLEMPHYMVILLKIWLTNIHGSSDIIPTLMDIY